MLAACRGAAKGAGIDYARWLVYPYIEQKVSLGTPISAERLCEWAGVRQSGFCRWRQLPPAPDKDIELRDEFQRVALEFPSGFARGSGLITVGVGIGMMTFH